MGRNMGEIFWVEPGWLIGQGENELRTTFFDYEECLRGLICLVLSGRILSALRLDIYHEHKKIQGDSIIMRNR